MSCRGALPAAYPGRFGQNVQTVVSLPFLLFSCHAAAVAKGGNFLGGLSSFLAVQLSRRGYGEGW